MVFKCLGSHGEPSGYRLQMAFVQMAMKNQGSVLQRAIPVAVGPALVSVAAMVVRDVESLTWFAAAINHPLAIQVFGVLFAFLVTARVARALIRWWEGMMAVVSMQDGWHDACMFIMSYVKKELLTLDAQLRRSDLDDDARNWVTQRIEKLKLFGQNIIHWFSLASALGLATLKSGEAKAFSEISCRYKDFSWIYSTKDKDRCGHTDLRVSAETMEYLGELTSEEESELAEVEEKTLLAVNWLYEALAIADGEQFIKVPPPILAGMNQKIAAGMYSYLLAYRIAAVPYPFPLAQISAFLMGVFLFLMPVVVEKFTQARMLTPLLSFLIALGYWGLNRVAIEIENPFGDDPNDLPLKSFSDTFIDKLMETSANCLKNVGSQKHKSVHSYSDCAMGIIPCKPPESLDKKAFKPTKKDTTTTDVPPAVGDGKATAKEPKGVPRSRSADPRCRTPAHQGPQRSTTVGHMPVQVPASGQYVVDPAWNQAKANFGMQYPVGPHQHPMRDIYGVPQAPHMAGIGLPTSPAAQQALFNVMAQQSNMYQFAHNSPPVSGMNPHAYPGFNGDYGDPSELS